MTDIGITVRVLGDYGPFSAMGKSIGYQVTIGESSFLIDCGSPLFQQIGGHGLKNIKGLIITHCHDDHKRWFTDLSLFCLYAPDISHQLPLYTSATINAGLQVASGPSLHTSLSADSKRVVDLSYSDYVDYNPLGPRARYRIVTVDEGFGVFRYRVVDREGTALDASRAKVVISSKNGEPRLLFKDPHYNEWVEPEQFYPFSAEIFYEAEQNSYVSPDGSFTIEAINAPVWHGVPSIGIRFRTAYESLVFSGDTAHDTELWQTLQSEKLTQRLSCSCAEFEAAAVLYGDINNYIERVWSRERYEEALHAFDNAVVIHDIALRSSVVHTDYRRLTHTVLDKRRTILTHSPDKMTSEWVLSKAEKTFVIQGDSCAEMVNGGVMPLTADIYHKQEGKYYVGFRNPQGNAVVFEHDGLLHLGGEWDLHKGKELYRVDLYEDVGGKYVPSVVSAEAWYCDRPDGRVELVTRTANGSHGVIVKDLRSELGSA